MNNDYLLHQIKQKTAKDETVLISFVGGGGKTTTLLTLAHVLKEEATVLITTTTAMFHPHGTVDNIYYETLPDDAFNTGEVNALYKGYIESKDKMIGIEPSLVNKIKNASTFDFILTEADGARRKPLKCYADHEPVIPDESQMVIVVIGADALYQPLTEAVVHRIKEFSEVTDLKLGDLITEEALIKVLSDPRGFVKDIPEKAESYLIINKVNSYPIKFDIEAFSNRLFSITPHYNAVLFTEMNEGNIIDLIERKKTSI